MPSFSGRVLSDQLRNASLYAASKDANDQKDKWGLVSRLNSISQKCKLVRHKIRIVPRRACFKNVDSFRDFCEVPL